jgi:DNA-binding winged helix-turn-helix (wHTH) protein
MDDPRNPARLRFGVFELDRRSGELFKAGLRIRLQEAPFKVLQALLERPGEIVTREELRRLLWPDDTFVDFDNGLNSAVNRLRSALGDRADRPKFVETVGRRGYRFAAPLTPPEQTVIAEPGRSAASVPMRLAVLPFLQLKPDPETDFLSFGLADAVASSLSGLDTLVVRSTIATARFRANTLDLGAIASALDVTLVLAGTVLCVGGRVRVSTQLVEAPSGTLLWTTTVDASLGDMFQVIESFVRRIVESLSLPLTVRDERQLDLDVSAGGRAFELYLRANEVGRNPDAWPQARDLYLESVRADPQYAPSWAKLGRVYRLMAKYAPDNDPQLRRLAEESFRRALAINPELSLAHYLYAQLEMETGRPVEALMRLADRARERRSDPQLFTGLVQACRYSGLMDASRASHTRAKQLDPAIKTSIAYTSLVAGNYVDAVAEARENDDPIEGVTLALLGRSSEATEALKIHHSRYSSNRVWGTFFDLGLAFVAKDQQGLIAHADACMRMPFSDPDGLFTLCLMLAVSGELPRALDALKRTVDAGFSCPAALENHPSLQKLLDLPGSEQMQTEMESRHRRAVEALEFAGGLGLV